MATTSQQINSGKIISHIAYTYNNTARQLVTIAHGYNIMASKLR